MDPQGMSGRSGRKVDPTVTQETEMTQHRGRDQDIRVPITVDIANWSHIFTESFQGSWIGIGGIGLGFTPRSLRGKGGNEGAQRAQRTHWKDVFQKKSVLGIRGKESLVGHTFTHSNQQVVGDQGAC